ncbi:MAG: DNA repair photoproduct lyase [Candidatus Brocadia sinica]|nr:MAG: DNA repair photoproduct lyase [Candidatus Brocadia sinica]
MIINPEQIKTFVNTIYPYLGVNKQQEVSRLLFEIAKRERIDYTEVVGCLPKPPSRFSLLKDYLLKRRYPSLAVKGNKIRPSFSDISINPALQVDVTLKPQIKPRNLFIEESVLHTEMVKRVVAQFPTSDIEIIKTYKEHTEKKQFRIEDYNRRSENFYLVRENYDFYKRCPCSSKSASCGYFIVNLGSGCVYECSYCVLQDYINSPGIILPVNIEDFFLAFQNLKHDIRCGSCELTDSLVFDHITGYSPQIVEFFRRYPKSTFEFKTKSDNIGLLTSVPGANNIVVSWSMNPQHIVETVEYFTATLPQRLAAAQKCVDCEYRVAFHFDPIIYYPGWEADYETLIHDIFNAIDGGDIAWISLGTLRMTPRLKKIIENRFPDNTILDEEFFVGHDGKLRYPRDIRAFIYKNMTSWIRRRCKDVPVYLCMEEKSMHLDQGT